MFKRCVKVTWILVGLSVVLLFIIVWMLSAPVQATSRPPVRTGLDTRNVSSIARYQVDFDASQTRTWIHTTRADWEGGARELLDSITISGSLQLAQRRFSDNITLTPRAAWPPPSTRSWMTFSRRRNDGRAMAG